MAMANTMVFFVPGKNGVLSFFPARKKSFRCSFQRRNTIFETSEDWISKNLGFVRALPVAIGIGSFGFVFLNRTLSGIPLVADASSSQSRADVLVVALAATVLLSGLVWISIQPRRFKPVELQGVNCMNLSLDSKEAETELIWAWETLRKTTCCKSLIILYKMRCIFQAGVAAESPDAEGIPCKVDGNIVTAGTLCTAALDSGKQSYLANLSLYPGRFELPFLPQNTQSVVIQPLGDDGVLILAGDTIRGFTPIDQVWITTLGQKLDVTLQSLQIGTQQIIP